MPKVIASYGTRTLGPYTGKERSLELTCLSQLHGCAGDISKQTQNLGSSRSANSQIFKSKINTQLATLDVMIKPSKQTEAEGSGASCIAILELGVEHQEGELGQVISGRPDSKLGPRTPPPPTAPGWSV